MADETIIRLTDEQKKQMKEATGQEHEEFKVETVGTKLAPRVAPRKAPRLAAKQVGKAMKVKVAAKKPPRLAAKAAPKMASRVAPKARRIAPKVAMKRHIAPKKAGK